MAISIGSSESEGNAAENPADSTSEEDEEEGREQTPASKKGNKIDKKKAKQEKKLKKLEKKLAKREKKLAKKVKKYAQKDKSNSQSGPASQSGPLPAGPVTGNDRKGHEVAQKAKLHSKSPPSQKPSPLGVDKWGKPVKEKVNGVAKGKLEVFRCKACEMDCSGEASFLQHLQGKKHCSRAGPGFRGLLPNDMGVIPKLSKEAEALIGPEAAAQAAAEAAQPEIQPQDLQVCLSTLSHAFQCTRDLQGMTASHACSRSRSRSRARTPHEVHRRSSQEEALLPPMLDIEKLTHSASRKTLPIFSFREQLLELVNTNQVTILEGDTGCGKTTQAPQYLLEDAAKRRQPCRILCTQPRRIAAIGVATRVAEERGPDDSELGGTVGYAVRHEHRASKKTCLLFCTTGVMLRRLQSDPDLQGVTYVVLDEVHERSVELDLLLLLLRQLCSQRKELRLLLMSATLDSQALQNYFEASASLKVPGRLFSVDTYFLEDALQLTRHVVDTSAGWAKGGGPTWKEKSEPADPDTLEELDLHTLQQRYGNCGESVQEALRKLDQDALNVDLVAELVSLDLHAPAGGEAVLVFVSGVREIEQVIEAVVAKKEFATCDARRWVLPLHGGLPYEEQSLVFRRPPAGVRKVIVATNVAETSLTIDDIGVVIDTGRMKENRYDGIRMMSSLEDVVASRANMRQRRGRAGRIGPGVCMHLVTKYRHDKLLNDYQLPEVKRTPLESLVLRIHASPLSPLGAPAVCALLLDAPDVKSVQSAELELVALGALQEDGHGVDHLTALGEHLVALPLHPRLGKLIVFGAAFGVPKVTDAALTIAAALSSRSPFVVPRDQRHEAQRLRVKWSRELAPAEGTQSDHLAVVAAYKAWDTFPSIAKPDFAKVNFLSHRTLQAMGSLKRQLLEHLSEARLVQPGLRARDAESAGRRAGNDGVLTVLSSCTSRSQEVPCIDDTLLPKLLVGLLCTALCPNVVHGSELGPKSSGIALGPRATLTVRERSGNPLHVQIHSSSVLGGEQRNAGIASPYLVYNELLKNGDSIRVREVTPVAPLTMLLFGSRLCEGSLISVCGWVRLRVAGEARHMLLEVRRSLDSILHGRIAAKDAEQPKSKGPAAAALLEAVCKLL